MDLNSPITDLPKVGPILTRKFERLGINTVEDLLYHVPSHYHDYSQILPIKSIRAGDTVTIHAKIVSIKNIYSRRGLKMQIGSVEDSSGKLQVLWFNQPYLIKVLYPGKSVSLSGKVSFFNRRLCLTSPDFELMEEEKETVHTGRLVPVYPETSGLSSKWIRTLELKVKTEKLKVNDFLPPEILKKFNLESLKKSFEDVHFPKNLEDAEKGRETLAFNELLFMNLRSVYRKSNWQKNKLANKLKIDRLIVNKFLESLPFALTDSQKKAVDEILSDLVKPFPMNRLLEGDVGSGKTVVAAAGMFAGFLNGYQSVIMAPTQIYSNLNHRGCNQNINLSRPKTPQDFIFFFRFEPSVQ